MPNVVFWQTVLPHNIKIPTTNGGPLGRCFHFYFLLSTLSRRGRLRWPFRFGSFGFFLEAEGGDLVGVGAVDDFGFVFHAEDDFVEFPFGDDEGVAGGGEGVLGLDGSFVGGAHAVEGGAGGLEGVAGVVGQVVGDGLECRVGVDVGLELLGGDAGDRCAAHVSSVFVCGVGGVAATGDITPDYA